MQTSTRTFIAAAGIFLLLTMSPLEARRTIEARAAVEGLSAEALRLEKTVRDLQEALAEDRAAGTESSLIQGGSRSWRGSGHLAARGHASGWWCNSQRSSFERRSTKLQDKVTAMKGSAQKPSFTDTATVVLEARKLAKSLDSAQRWGCAWVTDGSIKTAPFEQLVAIAVAENPCFAKGAALLTAAKNGTEAEQEQALGEAMSLMLSTSETCAPVEVSSNATQPDEGEAKDPEAAAEQLADKIGDPEAALGDSLLEQRAESLAELVERNWRSGFVFGIDVIVYALLGFLAVIVLALACTVALTLIVLFVGVLFCMLRTVILKLLSVVRSMGKFSFKGCAYVLWRQTLGWGINENNNDQYAIFKKGGGVKLIEATCAVPAIATVIAATPYSLPGAAGVAAAMR